jgi:hypothetical protein
MLLCVYLLSVFHEAHSISKQTVNQPVNQGEKDLKDMGPMFPE